MTSDPGMDGYFTGTDYPAQLVPQMTPAHIVAAAAWQGVVAPDLTGAVRVLDIGCGKGAALVLAAASHPNAVFEGIDGMPGHIVAADAFAAGLHNITFRHATFAEALHGAAPDSDLIILHGVLSWAGPAARQQAIDLAAARLKPGGILAASYNALPGGARQMAFQHMIRTLSRDQACGPAERFEAAFDLVRQMADVRFAAIQPEVVKRLTDLAQEAPTEYFLHEYMHDGWTPFWAADIKAAMAARGLEFVGSGEFLRTRPDLCLTLAQQRLAEGLGPDHEDLLIDMGLDSIFRTDLYARSPQEGDRAALRRTIWLGAEVEAGGKMAFATPGDGPAPEPELVQDVLDTLSSGPLPFGTLLDRVCGRASDVTNAIEQLLIAHLLIPLGPPAADARFAMGLNFHLSETARKDDPAIEGLAGSHGPVFASTAQIRALPQAPAADTCATEPGNRNSLARLGARFRRLGVPHAQ